jgi:hypothetical protein
VPTIPQLLSLFIWHWFFGSVHINFTMKKITFYLSLLFIAGCAPTTMITGSWKSSKIPPKEYKTVFVVALTGHTVAKSTTENDIANVLNKQNINTIKSIDEFPPGFAKDSIPKNEIIKKVRSKNCDAILTISLLKKSTESRYVRGGYAYDPSVRFMYYGNFWGYYNYWYPYTYSPGYYTDEDVYFIETNFYDAESEMLVWSAQSSTYSYNGLAPVSKEFASTIVDKMKKDGIIK